MEPSVKAEGVMRISGSNTYATVLACACCLGALSDAAAQAGRAEVNEGNRLYEEGRFEEAHEKYLEALRENPELAVIRFNDGNALYKKEDYERAAQAYGRVLESEDSALAASAWYNLSNALYRDAQLESSLNAYKEALRREPNNQDAKHNLERVLERLQQQDRPERPNEPDPQDQPEEQNQDDPGQPAPQEQPQPNNAQPGQPGQDRGSADQPRAQEQTEARAGEMTREEAERLLEAFDEDAGDVNRRPVATTDREPLKDW